MCKNATWFVPSSSGAGAQKNYRRTANTKPTSRGLAVLSRYLIVQAAGNVTS
jgi:hypothetical protein